MTDIQLQFYSGQNGNVFGAITDDHIRAIVERAKRLGLIAPYSGVNTVPATGPGGYATTVSTSETTTTRAIPE